MLIVARFFKCGILSANFDNKTAYGKNMETITKILNTLNVPGTAGRVYRELLMNGETTPRILAQRMSMTRPSVYDQIHILEEFGLVATRMLDNKTYVAPSPARHLLKLLEEKKEEIEHDAVAFGHIVQSLESTTRTDAPRIRFFEGREAVQRALHDTLWSGKTDLLALWPYEEMLELFGESYLKSFNQKRVRQKITLRTIWPKRAKTKKSVWEGSDTGVERRYIEHSKSLGMGYTIYEDNVIFISSKKESFGFIISSHEYATMMRFQFETLWQTASKS